VRLDDEWIRKNEGIITPETAKFLLSHLAQGRIVLNQESAGILKRRMSGSGPSGPVPPGPDWAERAAGDYES
jgi:hypothetical protein